MASATPPPADTAASGTPPLIIRGLDPVAVRQGAKLTPEFVDQLCARIAKGHSFYASAVALGISRRTFDRWLAKGRAELAGLEQAAQDAETDPDFSDLTLYGYLCHKVAQTQAATVNDAEGRVYRDKPELYLRLSSAGRAAGWGNKVDVAVLGQIEHTHTVVQSPLKTISDSDLAEVLAILEECGALDAIKHQQAQDVGDTVDAVPSLPLAELAASVAPLEPVSSAPVPPPVVPTPPPAEKASLVASQPMAQPVDEDPFSERTGARYDRNHSVFDEGARRPHGLSGNTPYGPVRWNLGQRSTRSLSDIARDGGW